jgi:DNA-3-methyladenine glycosylase
MNPLSKRVRRLRRRDLPVETVALARYLLGKLIVRRFGAATAAVRIVETEAYVQNDAAAHAFRGPTQRNGSLYLAPGHAYVYLCYGTSYLLNVSSEPEGVGCGVLLRAAEPVSGVEWLHRANTAVKSRDLCRGPGLLSRALGVDLRSDGMNLVGRGDLWLAEDGYDSGCIVVSRRIGITKAADLPLRFFLHGNAHVSGPKRQHRLPQHRLPQ